MLNQQHFSQSEAVASVVIGARLVSSPGGLGTFVTTFVPVSLRIAPMRQDVNTSFAFVITAQGGALLMSNTEAHSSSKNVIFNFSQLYLS